MHLKTVALSDGIVIHLLLIGLYQYYTRVSNRPNHRCGKRREKKKKKQQH